MKQKISTQLATGFALIVLITVLLIGAVAEEKFFGTAGRITAIPV